jgi:hypothetical protein
MQDMTRTIANSSASRTQKGDRAAHPNTLVVIDPSLQEHQAIASEALPGAKILLLDPQQDGVQQITKTLQQHPQLTHVHIFSHCSCESISLGKAHLNLDTLEYYAWDLQTWFPAHAFISPSVQLHGCTVAIQEAKAEFIERLHQLTGASIDTSELVKCCVGV